jgi:carboxyl-terminal processing protease
MVLLSGLLCAFTTIAKDEPAKPDENSEEKKYGWIKTTADVIGMVEDRGFRQVNFSDCIQDALKAYLARIDSHTRFFTAEGAQSVRETASGKFSGIGVSITSKALEDDSLVLVDVIEGGPAHKAGMQVGDKIFEVDGVKLQGLSSDESIGKIKGEQGSWVKLKIVRGKKPLEVKVKRDIVKDNASSCYYFKDQGIYYLTLKIFSEPAAQQMKSLLVKANDKACKGIILDLRNNPGGVLESAVDMAGLFVDKGSVVVITKNNKNKVVASYKTSAEPVLKNDVPIFIITNNFTASAAEILAGCLRHYSDVASSGGKDAKAKRNLMVFVVGMTTHGKGTVQEVIPVGQGCAMKLTTMLYFLPDDTSIQAVGIEPDFLVKPKSVPEKEMKWIDEVYGRESALKNHITALEVKKVEGKEVTAEEEAQAKKKKPSSSSDDDDDEDPNNIKPMTEKQMEDRRKKEIGQNVQVQACVNMINLLDITRKSMPALINTRAKALTFLKKNYLTDNPVVVESIKPIEK